MAHSVSCLFLSSQVKNNSLQFNCNVCKSVVAVPQKESGQTVLSNVQRHMTKSCWLNDTKNNAPKTSALELYFKRYHTVQQ